ncbi:MAG: hypothetical protein R3359_04330, partial [Marinirhabdus sp.]|nr:hypothetical protein [Marinirhabdus sp.]
MKSKFTLSVISVFFGLFFIAETLQAQSPIRDIPTNLIAESSSKDHFTSSSAEQLTHVQSARESATSETIALMPPNMIANTTNNIGPLNATKPKVSMPTAVQLLAVDQQVAKEVASLKKRATATLRMGIEDQVALSYNANTGKINLTPLNNRSAVVQEISLAALNGLLIVEGNYKDNNLLVDDAILDLGIHIVYDGGSEQTQRGDILTIENTGTPWQEVVSTAYNKNSGTIVVNQKSTITYTGLEPIIILGTGSGNLTINLPDVPNPDVVIESEINPNLTIVSGSTFENVLFNNDFDSYAINGGTDIDNVSFQGVDAAFDGDMTLNFDTDDLVTFETTATNLGAGNLMVNTGFLVASADITTIGNISLTSERNTIVNNNATVSVTDGAISIAGGTAIVMNDVYTGILLDNGNLSATTGSITLTGTASNDGASSKTIGVYAIGTSLLETVSGDISITGTGPSSGLDRMSGIRINDNAENAAILRSVDGDIILNGTGGNGTDNFQTGVVIDGLNPIQLTGTGSLEVTGVGGSGANSNYGIGIQTAAINVADGDVTMNGTSGDGNEFLSGISLGFGASIQVTGSGALSMIGIAGSGVFGEGVNIFNATIALGDGDIVINGTGNAGSGVGQNGINIFDGASITTTNGDIAITGTAGTAPANFHQGIFMDSVSIGTTGSGDITLNGTGGIGNERNQGLGIQTSNITSSGGSISLIGQGGQGLNLNYGNFIFDSTISDLNGGTILIEGTGGAGTETNYGSIITNNSTIATTSGDISINGTAGSSTNAGIGLYIAATIQTVDGNITATGLGNGTAGGGTNDGIGLFITGIIQTVDGNITATGVGNGTGIRNRGIDMTDTGLVESTGTGTITISGVGANASGLFNMGFFHQGTVRSFDG